MLLGRLIECDRCLLLFEGGGGEKRAQLLSVPAADSDEEREAQTVRLAGLMKLGEDSVDAPAPDPAHSHYLGLPLIGVDQVTGFLLIERQRVTFSDDEVRLFSVVASQLGGYLTLVRLHHRVKELDRFRQGMYQLVAHDLKNPLSAVIANVAFVMEVTTDKSDDVQACLDDVQIAAQRILRLIANMLDLARLESSELPLQRSLVDLSALLTLLTRQRQIQAKERGVQLPKELPTPGTVNVNVDEALLSRVIENILDNALRHTSSGGRISVDLTETPGVVRFCIGNSGARIPEASRTAIFQKFGHGSERSRMNLGLGLYFCRLAVEAHGGRIWVEGTLDYPTIFVVELPVTARPPH